MKIFDLLEQRKLMAEKLKINKVAPGFNATIEDTTSETMILRGMQCRDVYYFHQTVINQILRASETMPDYFVEHDMFPSEEAFCWLENSIDFRSGFGKLAAFSWHALKDMAVCVFHHEDLGLQSNRLEWRIGCSAPLFWLYGRSISDMEKDLSTATLPDTVNPDTGEKLFTGYGEWVVKLKFFLSMLIFLKQKLVSLRKEVAPRAVRRRMEMPEAAISVVTLRQFERDQDKKESTQQDWAYRWYVSGHWRQQACGEGFTERKPVYIEKYIKGPDDKPIRPETENRVFMVKRGLEEPMREEVAWRVLAVVASVYLIGFILQIIF